jgi:peptide/nickel transport system ATP-binding protein
MEICRRERPALTILAPEHRAACFAASPEVRPVPDGQDRADARALSTAGSDA